MAVIKSGGYKISALDIERELLNLSYISEAMVVGVPDEEYGQKVAAAITLRDVSLTNTYLCCNLNVTSNTISRHHSYH